MMRIVAMIMVALMVVQTIPVKAFEGDFLWGPIVSNEYRIVFHTVRLFAGEEELPTLYVKEGASIGSLPEAPSLDDMIFAGWFADGEEITDQTVILSDMEVTAVYLSVDDLTEDGLYLDPVSDSDFDVGEAAYIDPETHEMEEALALLQAEKVQVSVLYGSIPDEVNFKQYTQEETDELIARYGLGARSRSSSTASGYTAFDVAMLQADGETYVGDGVYSVSVELDFNVQDLVPVGAQIDSVNYTLHHIHEDTAEELAVSVEGRNVTFTTEKFSPFVLQYTVDFAYLSKNAVLALDFSGYEHFENDSGILHESGDNVTILDLKRLVGSAEVKEEDQQVCGVAYLVHSDMDTALTDFDADFFDHAAVNIQGAGVEYGDGLIRLVDDVESATIVFAADRAKLTVRIRNYKKDTALAVSGKGPVFRFFGGSAAVGEILEACGAVSRGYTAVSVNDTDLVSAMDGVLTVQDYFDEVLLEVELEDGSEVQIRLTNPAPVEAGETVFTGVGSFTADTSVPAGTELRVDAEPVVTEEIRAAVHAAVTAALGEDAQNVSYFDIRLEGPDGEKLETGASVTAKVDLPLPVEDGKVTKVTAVSVFHVAEDGSVETLDASYTLAEGKISSISFHTDGFSVFGVSYTVEFTYAGANYSIPGESQILLSELIGMLGITSAAGTKIDVADVAGVSFTNGRLVKVEQVSGLITCNGGTVDAGEKDFLLTSLEPFRSDEKLTIQLMNGEEIVVDVTDAQYGEGNIEIPDSGIVDMTELMTTFTATCQSNTEDVAWDAHIDFLFKYVFSEAGISAVKDYASTNNASPTIVYDFSEVFNQTALNSVSEETFYLTTGLKTVGSITISGDGRLTMTFSDLTWLKTRNSIRGTFDLDLIVDEDEARDYGEDYVEFPGTTTGTHITYKTDVSNASKSLGWPNSVENADGSVTIFYNAAIDANTALSSLVFTDEIIDEEAVIDAASVRVNGHAVSGLSDGARISFDVAEVAGIEKTEDDKLEAGRYTVSYTATIPAEKVAAMAQGETETIVNSSKWKANGNDEIEAPPVTYEWTKPITPIPVTKSADKTTVDVPAGSDGETVNFTLTFGDENTPLADFRIADYITDVFTDYSSISVSWNGGSHTLTAGPLAADSSYSTGSVTLFDYTFPSETSGYGPVTVTYSAKTIDATTAKKNNIFDAVDTTNTAQELRTNNSQTSTTVITYPSQPDISVAKTAFISDEDRNEDGTLKDGAVIAYTITIGDAATDISNLTISDSMSHLQSVDLSTAAIQIGSGTSQTLTDYITSVGGYYDSGWTTGGGSGNLFSFTVPAGENDSEVMGPIVITYTTAVVSTADANAAAVWGSQDVNNTVYAGGKSSTDGGTKDYGEEPKFPVEKEAKDGNDQEITSPLLPDAEIHYTVTYGGEGWTLDGTTIVDEMSDIQKLAGPVTVTLSRALLREIVWPDGTVWQAGATSFTMPTGSSQWAGDGVVWNDFFDDGQYSLNGSWPRVYCLRLPDGRQTSEPYFAEGTVMTVTYATTVISEAEALEFSIVGLQNAFNRTSANHQFSQTTVPVQFPEEVTHNPAIEKEFDHWDFENRMVYWRIRVKAAEGSIYPLENVYVRENVQWNEVFIKNDNQGIYHTTISADAFDMINARVVTGTGTVLQPGEDYTVHKGSGRTDDPYFYFETLNESVTITVGYSVGDNDIIDGFHAENAARVDGGNESQAKQDYNTPKIDMTKNGDAYDPANRVIRWIVRVNPAKKTLDPDLTQVLFDDTIPAGLQLINYSGFLNGRVNTAAPSIHVAYSGKVNGPGREYGADSYVPARWENGNQISGYDQVIFATITNSSIHANIAAVGVYNNADSTAYLSEQSYTVTYYTWVTDEAWDRITSSLTGSETFTNTATVDMGDQDDLTGTGSRTVTSESYITKEDITQENSEGIVIGSNNQSSNVLSYQIDINLNAWQLVSEEDATLTLTDCISTNMDLDTSEDGVTIEYEKPDGTYADIRSVGSEDPNYGIFQAMKISYNDNTRYLTIINIPDKMHFRVTYNTVVRAQGTDDFENTAVLTGGGSHSASTHETHTIQKSGGNISGGTASITLRKIDENDISRKLQGAVFEFYECTLSKPGAWQTTVQVPVPRTDPDTHAVTIEWVDEDHLNFNRIEDAAPSVWENYPGNGETAQLKADFTIVSERLVETATSDMDGVVSLRQPLSEETLYYWIETAAPEGYTAELNVKHYFVVYQVYDDDGNLLGIETQEVGRDGSTRLKEWETRQWRGWALDDAASYANGITVASLAADNNWTVNNQKEEYTSVSATKEWEDDYDNFYETRPEAGIQLKLIRMCSDGTEEQYGPIIPINADKNGNWPTYVWQQLPKTGDNDVTYTYRVEELPVSGYTTAYTTAGAEVPAAGIESGEITVINKLIPTRTNVSVKKIFEQDGTNYPDQILVYLYEITTDKETGAQTRAQRSSYALTAAGGWEYVWKNLPTKDDDGNPLTYTVVEGAVGDGFSYTVFYSDNGAGITGNTAEDPLVITNKENGLEITKTFGGDAARLMEDNETAAAMRRLISFTVTDGTNQVSFTVEDMTANADGSYSFKLTSTTYPWLTPGKTVYVQETNTAFTNTNLVSVSYTVNGGETVTVTDHMETVTVNGYTVTGGLDTIAFENDYEEDKIELSVDKTWLDVNGDVTGWPEGVAVTFNLTADEGHGAIATGDTRLMTGAGQIVTFTGLPRYVLNSNTEIVYSVTETVDGYDSGIISRTTDAYGNVRITVTNRKASPRLYVQKVWYGDGSFIPSSLTVDLYESDTAGETTGGTFRNSITLTAANSWKGYFDTDSEGNDLVVGKYYYIQERGAGGWTLRGYSDENGQAFVDMETITVTNTRTPPPPAKTSVSVQKKWTVNGGDAEPEDWEPVEVQLVRYKAESPRGINIKIYYNDNGYRYDPRIETDVCEEVTIKLNPYDVPESRLNNPDYKYTYTIYSGDWWLDQSGILSSGSSIDKVEFNLSQSPYTGHDMISVVFGPAWGDLANVHLEPTISGDEPVLGDDVRWSGPEVVTYDSATTFTLNTHNSWQYEFSGLDAESDNGAYLYAYTVVETDTSRQVSRIITGGTGITLQDESTEETGGNVVITNNKEYGSITVNKTALKNEAPDTEAAGQTIKVGLFAEEQATGSAATLLSTKTILLDENGEGSVTFDRLALGSTYYVYELDGENRVVADGEEITVGSHAYTASETTASAELTSAVKTGTVSITNSRTTEEFGSVRIVKIDESTRDSGTRKYLAGAVFRIQKWDGTAYVDYAPESQSATVTTGTDGVAVFQKVESGEYRIIETATPPGYVNLMTDDVYFRMEYNAAAGLHTITRYDVAADAVDEQGQAIVRREIAETENTLGVTFTQPVADDPATADVDETAPATFTIGNSPGVELPATGGPGRTFFTATGATLMMLAGLWRMKVKRKRT